MIRLTPHSWLMVKGDSRHGDTAWVFPLLSLFGRTSPEMHFKLCLAEKQKCFLRIFKLGVGCRPLMALHFILWMLNEYIRKHIACGLASPRHTKNEDTWWFAFSFTPSVCFVFVCVVYTRVCLCEGVQRPKQGVECLPLLFCSLVSSDRVSYATGSVFFLLDWLASELEGSTCLISTQCWNYSQRTLTDRLHF